MKLSDFELDVMQLFWEKGACSAPDIHKAVSLEKKYAYTTVKTIIDRLEEKGALERTGIQGRSITYGALVAPETISRSLLPSFVRRFFAGKPSKLIVQLVQDDKLSDEDVEYLENYLKERKQKKE